MEKMLRRFGYKLPDFTSKEKRAIGFTLAVKVAPGVPAFVKNYGIVLAGVGFLPYFVLSLLFTGAYGAVVIVLGDSLFDRDPSRLLIVAVLFAALTGGVWWRRRTAHAA